MNESEMIQALQAIQNGEQAKATTTTTTTTTTTKPKANEGNLPSWFSLSVFGEQVMGELKGILADNIPVLLNGGTGMGKTVILLAIAKMLGRDTVGFNCYTGMDIQSLVGIWRPQADGSLVWQDGLLTQGIKRGAIIRIEEYTRANPELKSRLFGILDSKDRTWNMFENGTESVHVPDETTIVASANPTGNGYVGTMREDKASMSRFGAVLEINEPLADERHALMDTLGHSDTVDRILSFAEMLRKEPATYLSTRDLHFLAMTLKRGVSPIRAITMVLTPKYQGQEKSIMTHGRAVFEEMDVTNLKETVEGSVNNA